MGRYKIIRSTINYQYYFRFVADNGKQIISSEGYIAKESCKNGISAVQNRSPYDGTYQRQDVAGNYRFNMLSTNGQVIARSSEGYVNRQDREHAIDIMKRQGGSSGTDDLT